MIRKLYLVVGSIALLLCVVSISYSLLFHDAYCPVCEARMTEVRTVGDPLSEKHATMYHCPKCGTGFIR